MFGETLVLVLDGEDITLNKINQDGYSSEYLYRDPLSETRITISNSTYSDKKRPGVLMDRHTVDVKQVVYPVAPSTISKLRHSYFVVENQQGDTLADPIDIAEGLAVFMTEANITKLTNFES